MALIFSSNDMYPLSWEPDPLEADPLKGSRYRRKVDILGMIVGIIGSKDQLINEYRVMLAEKLLNKSDYDIDSEIRTLELLKVFHKALTVSLQIGIHFAFHLLSLKYLHVGGSVPDCRFILERAACRNVK